MSSSGDESTPANNGQHQLRTARKSTRAPQPQPQPRAGPSTRREAARKASKAISASASSSGTPLTSSGPSTGTSSFDKSMENFNPDMSQREKRKISKKFETPAAGTSKPSTTRPALHDEKGRHIASGKDLCDCLNERCPGCFFECPKCSSQKCGTACRVNRTFVIDSIEYHDQEKTVINPLLKK